MGDINALLDESITGVSIREQGPPALDLSKIDFEALAKRFRESKRKNTDLEVLKAAIRAQLEKLIELNHTRADFAEKFEALIESYNAGSRSIEELFDELVKLSRNLSEEQQRHVRENMTEEQLVIFDILTRPAPELTPEERAEVKEGRPRTAQPPQAVTGTELAPESGGSISAQARHRGRLGFRAPASLHTRPVSAEVLRGVRARIRKLSRTECWRLCNGGMTRWRAESCQSVLTGFLVW